MATGLGHHCSGIRPVARVHNQDTRLFQRPAIERTYHGPRDPEPRVRRRILCSPQMTAREGISSYQNQDKTSNPYHSSWHPHIYSCSVISRNWRCSFCPGSTWIICDCESYSLRTSSLAYSK